MPHLAPRLPARSAPPAHPPLPLNYPQERGRAAAPLAAAPAAAPAGRRAPLVVVAQRAVTRKVQVVLAAPVAGLGAAGALCEVKVGHFRNFLLPNSLASLATPAALGRIASARAADERAALEVKAKATAMATALATIGKFVIKKKAGEGDALFGSVTSADVVEAIRMQTGRELDKREVAVPAISKLGTYEVTVRLHPEVVGAFKVVVQKDTSG